MLPPDTQALWDALKGERLLAAGALIGGTALAMRIQHRLSEDLDFLFPGTKLPAAGISACTARLRRDGWKIERRDSPAAMMEFETAGMELHDYQQDFLVNGRTKLTFLAGDESMEKLLRHPAAADGPRVATIEELFDLKAITTASRSKTRDWVDIYVLMTSHGFTMERFVEAFKRAGALHTLETALNRICSGQTGPSDEGFHALMDHPPTLQEMTAFFQKERDRYEQQAASRKFQGR